MTGEHAFPRAASRLSTRCLGIDLEPIERFTLAAKPGGRAFLDRVYTPAEQARVSGNPLLLALYFTAKEAVAKALGTGLGLSAGARVNCQDIEIRCAPGHARPTVVLRNGAAARAADLQLSGVVVCWAHTAWLACAVAVDADCPVLLASLVAMLQGELSTVAKANEENVRNPEHRTTLADIAQRDVSAREDGARS